MGPGIQPQIACFARATSFYYIGNFWSQKLGPLDQILDPHLGLCQLCYADDTLHFEQPENLKRLRKLPSAYVHGMLTNHIFTVKIFTLWLNTRHKNIFDNPTQKIKLAGSLNSRKMLRINQSTPEADPPQI